MRVLDVVDSLVGLVMPDDSNGLLALAKDLITLRNATDHQLAVCAASIESSGIAAKAGSTTAKLLQVNGAAPGCAYRWLRVGMGLPELDRTAGYSRDGFLSAEHVDAVVKGIAHISDRSGVPIRGEWLYEFERKLLTQAISGASPGSISATARALGNELARNTGGLPPAEDPSLNSLDYDRTSDGRLVGKFDVDAVIGEKLFSALDCWSKPRPEPDGSEDSRTPTQRRADALHRLLDCGGGRGAMVSVPRTEVMVTVPADHPEASSLSWMGPITEATAAALACDSSITSVTLDGEEVPIDISPAKRLFTGLVRKAIIMRDACCVKCGGPAQWTDCHHIVHWTDGGSTTLGNGCLLCRSCHRAVHHSGWDVIMGHDGHPWLIPPADLDPSRRPQPAFNRRTMTLAA